MPTRKRITVVLLCVSFVLMIMLNVYTINIDKSLNMKVSYNKRNFSEHIIKFNYQFWREKDTRKILVWTPFFDSWNWVNGMETELKKCSASCIITSEKSELDNADAVLFHISDMWKYRGIHGTIYNRVIPMPKTRKPEQVWVLMSQEPITKFYGKFEHTFNWTMTYRRDSTISNIYNGWRKKNSTELKSINTDVVAENFFQMKTKFIATAVSNCYDRAKRYKIIKELDKYVHIDKFGRCYGNRTPNLSFLSEYKFYLAIENTLCRDYITEKYWGTLSRKQIPVIATTKYNTEILPPDSYINVFDFDSMKSLADELLKIENNETLYNSYFQWRKYYTSTEGSTCRLCKELHTNKSAQSYVDTEAWVRDDMCLKSTAWSMVSEILERFLFNLGLA